jgi:hypothetical protein
MIWIILAIIAITLVIISIGEMQYHCPKCDQMFTIKICKKCGNLNGYSDRHSDSSQSIKNAIKLFKKRTK